MEVRARRDLIGAFFIAAVMHGVAAVLQISAPLPSAVPPPAQNKHLAISFVSTYREAVEITTEKPPQAAVTPLPEPVKKPVTKPKETIRRHVERPRQAEKVRENLPDARSEPVAPPLPAASVRDPGPLQEPVPSRAPVVTTPLYRENPPPSYPAKARRRGYGGVTVLSAEILTDGRVGELRVKTSSGFEILDDAALRAVKTWTFEPARKDGVPVTGRVDIPVRFELTGDRK